MIEERALQEGASHLPELSLRLERARALSEEQWTAQDRASANELLDKLDGILPLIAEDDRLRVMLEAELDGQRPALGRAQRERARKLLGRDWAAPLSPEDRRQLELLLATAVRDRDDALREERIAGELQLNYLTWLGLVLLVLIPIVFTVAVLASSSGLWADVLLALLAGALGGTLSGVLRLRSPETRLTPLKNVGLAMLVQPLLGAVGGSVVFAIWRSGLVRIAGLDRQDWAAVAVVAFAGGFSERFFFKSLARITGSTEQAKDTRQTDGPDANPELRR